MIDIRTENIIDAFKNDDIDIMICFCNCQKNYDEKMKLIFPEAYQADKDDRCDIKYNQTFIEAREDNSKKLGYYTIASYVDYKKDNKFKFIFNLYVHDEMKNDLVSFYSAIMYGFRRISKDFLLYPNMDIGMPKIQCDLPDYNWKVIEALVKKEFNRLIYVYEEEK